MKLKFIAFINMILASLLAGTSFGIWMGFNPKQYSADCYLSQQLNMVHSLNALMFLLVVAATITTLLHAYFQKHNQTIFVILLISAACFIACIAITRMGNVPIQNEILGWSPSSIPADWVNMRDAWWTFHIQRTIAELIALALICWASLKHNTLHENLVR